jgi:hypothetical protein
MISPYYRRPTAQKDRTLKDTKDNNLPHNINNNLSQNQNNNIIDPDLSASFIIKPSLLHKHQKK